jgi:AAA+ superfamily predicted ATPase
LGVRAVEVEKILSTVLKLATRWKATLLLDEADVFVAQRTIENTDRNALVSVFLRKLEYYEGILFITTNRVQTFDEAIASRVHLALKYHPLDEGARKEVWKMFLAKAKNKHGNADYNLKVLGKLASKKLNGREVSALVNKHTHAD